MRLRAIIQVIEMPEYPKGTLFMQNGLRDLAVGMKFLHPLVAFVYPAFNSPQSWGVKGAS